MAPARLIFDRGPQGGAALFEGASQLIEAHDADEVPGAFEALQAAQAGGKWLAGFCSYELGYVLCDRLNARLPQYRDVPLMQFGVFDGPAPAPVLPLPGGASLGGLRAHWSAGDYAATFQRVHDYLRAGDIYQANLTFPLEGRWSGDPLALYAALQSRQPVPHGAFVDFGQGTVLLSRSPELFFALDSGGTLQARPMKGTRPRGDTPAEDAALSRDLAEAEKDRAENLMIVDLLRNDLGRIAKIGTVRVPELFAIESYATVHQMTSLITAQIAGGTTLAEIFTALFPCGSVTGAPKIRAMEILSDLEPRPRGAYCGGIGWIAPDGAMSFNVAIRTVTCFADGTARINVGGGVVYDSTAGGEYAEALLKGRFALTGDAP